MKIEGLGAFLPERVVDNQTVLELIEQRSRKTFQGDLAATLTKIQTLFTLSGLQTRRWLDKNASVFDPIEQACREALTDAACQPQDIDLLIYAAVDRRVVEPGQSFLIAKSLGMQHTRCFDVLEACNSWSRAAEIAHDQLLLGKVGKVMVVCAEFIANEESCCLQNYTLRREADLDWAFPAFTMGDAASAVIFSHDEQDWQFEFQGRPEGADACYIAGGFPAATASHPAFDLPFEQTGQFFSSSKRLHQIGKPVVLEMLKTLQPDSAHFDIVIPHSHTCKGWQDIAQDLGIDIPYYFIYSDYGNVAAGSVPVALYLARAENALQRGDKVLVIMGAAGMSFANYRFIF